MAIQGDPRSQAYNALNPETGFYKKGGLYGVGYHKSELKTREEILESLGIKASPPQVLTYKEPNRIEPYVYKPPPPKKGGGGFLGVLGDVIKIIDKPRAIIVSSIKETGDLLSGRGFSATDWWNQVGDNMMMGEVMRDWGVDLPGPLDFVVGLGLDIALDPLTYLTGGAVAARYANPKRVADALGEASKVYRKAGPLQDLKKADMLTKAQGKVLSKNSILSAGDEALQEVGMRVGIGFSVPGTGRLSRSIIERPLRKVSPKAGRYLDGRRVKQLPEANLPEALKGKNNPWLQGGERSFDFSKAGNVNQAVKKIATIRAKKANKATAMSRPARQAMRMPVQSKFYIPGSANFVRVSAGLFGTAFGAAAATKIGRSVGNALGTQSDYNHAVRKLGREIAQGDEAASMAYDYLRVAYRGANTANSEVVKWQHYTLENLKDLRVKADELGVDFNDLIYKTADEPYQASVPLNLAEDASEIGFAANPRVTAVVGNTPEGKLLHEAAQEFWNNAGQRIQQQLEPYGIKFDLVDFQDEFYVPRYIDVDRAQDLIPGVAPYNDLVTVDMKLGINHSGVGGQMSKARMYAPASRLKRMRASAKTSAAKQAGLIAFDPAITDDMVIKAARKNNVAIKTEFGTARPVDDVFDELMNLPSGVTFEYADTVGFRGSRITNSYMGRRLEDVAAGKSLREQMKEIGETAYGSEYRNIFVGVDGADDVQNAVSRYINQTSAMMRENMFMATLDNAGITVNIAAADKAAAAIKAGKQVPYFGSAAQAINKRLGKAIKDIDKGLGPKQAKLAREEAILARYTARQAEFEEAIEAATGPQRTVKGTEGMAKSEVEQYTRLNQQVSEAERQLEEIHHFTRALLDPNETSMPELSRDVFEMLRPPPANVSVEDRLFTNSLIDRAEYLKNSEQAALVVNDMAETVNQWKVIRQAVADALNAVDSNSATGAQFKKLLDDLDTAIEGGRKTVEGLNLNWIDNAMKDPTVQSATLFKQLADEVLKDTGYKITRNGRKISKVTFTSPVASELKNLTKRMKTAARQAAKRGDQKTADQILGDIKAIDNWTDRVSEIRTLQRSLGDERFYGAAMRAIKSVEEGITRIRDISGISAIDDQIQEIEQLIKNTSGINDLDGPSQEMLTSLIGQRQRLLDANEANFAAMDDIVGEWQRKMANLNSQLQAKQIDVDTLTQEVAAATKKKNDLLESVNLEIRMGTESGTLSNRLAYITDQQAAIRELSKARSQNTLADVYGGALNDYLIEMTPVTTRGPFGDPRGGIKSVRARRAFDGKALVGGFDDDTVDLMVNAMSALGKLQDPQAMKSFWKRYDAFLNWWKAQAVTSPGFFMRNTLGGTWINNQINDVPMYMHARVREVRKLASEKGNQNVLAGLEALIAEGKPLQLKGPIRGLGGPKTVDLEELRIFRSWFETGVAGQGQVTQEIRTTLDQIGAVRGGAWGQGTWKPYKPDFKPMNWVRARNQDSEFMLRGALAHHNMMMGDTLEDAVTAVRRYHFDYSDLSQQERMIKKVIPFWTWQRNILPVLVESIGKKPRAWARLQQVKEELELTSPMENMVPDYFGANMGIRLPFTKGGNRVYVLPDLPFRDMQKITKDMDNFLDVPGLVEGTGRLALESTMPPVKLPIELMMGKQVFGGIPFSGRYQQAPIWANTPVVKQALLLTGLAKQSKGGRLVMTDKQMYSVDQFLPLIGRIRRLIPNERAKQDAALTTWMNTFLGTGLRVNTPLTKRSEFIRRQRETQKMLQDIIDIELRQR